MSLFAAQLLQQPGAQGYVLFYGGRRGVSGAARTAGKRAKAYLVKERGIASDRIVIVEGGLKEKLTVDLWIVPMGSTLPTPEPTVDPGAVKRINSPVRNNSFASKRHGPRSGSALPPDVRRLSRVSRRP